MSKPIKRNPNPSIIRKDPAGFRTTEKANARLLLNLVNDFEELVLRELARANGRALAEATVQTRFSLESIKSIESYIDARAAPIAAKKMATSSVEHGRDWADKAMQANGIPVPTSIGFRLPVNPAFIEAFEERDLSEIKGLTGDMSTRLTRTMSTGLAKGETPQQIAKRVREVTGFAKNKAITIARTETLRAGNDAAKERYKQMEVEMVEYLAALDDRVCEDCEELHGKRYPIEDAPELPIHPNCRCTLVPYMGEDEE